MIVANLATYPPREAKLRDVVAALAGQLDRMNVVLNEYDTAPAFLADYPNVVPILPERDTKDTGKFLPDVSDADWVLLVDDDIGYAEDYVLRSVASMSRLEAGHVGGYLGIYYRPKTLLKRIKALFESDRTGAKRHFDTTIFKYDKARDDFIIVEQVGTGTMIARPADLPPFSYVESAQKFVDVRMALWCHETGRTMVSLPRYEDMLKRREVTESIKRDFTQKNRSFLWTEVQRYAGKTPRAGQAVTAR